MKRKTLTRPQLRKSIREKYTLLLKTARVLTGCGLGQTVLTTKPFIDVFQAQDGWQAAVFPEHADISYEGFVVGFRRSKYRYATERDALAALDALLTAVTGAMSPFVKNAKRARDARSAVRT